MLWKLVGGFRHTAVSVMPAWGGLPIHGSIGLASEASTATRRRSARIRGAVHVATRPAAGAAGAPASQPARLRAGALRVGQMARHDVSHHAEPRAARCCDPMPLHTSPYGTDLRPRRSRTRLRQHVQHVSFPSLLHEL